MVRTSNFVFVCVIVILVGVILAQNFGSIPTVVSRTKVIYLPSLPASAIGFSPSEIQTWTNIRNRLEIYNSDPAFQGDRGLQWISLRNSTSAPWDNYNQKSMEWLCFWSGQGANGEWEAVVSIYNSPNSTSDFVVEVSRFTWHAIQVKLNGAVVADFPQVTNDTVSLGYYSFHVSA